MAEVKTYRKAHKGGHHRPRYSLGRSTAQHVNVFAPYAQWDSHRCQRQALREGIFHWKDGGREWLLLRRADTYNLMERYLQGVGSEDPEATPHGYLYSLRRDNLVDALDYMARFGPLTKVKKTSRLPSKTKSLVNSLSVGPWDLVDLSEFWRLHARFQIVMDLWNAQNHMKELRMVWKRLYADLEFIDGSRTEPPIGKHPGKGFSHSERSGPANG